MAQTFVYPYLAEFSALCPLINLDLQISDRIVDLVEQHFDLGLRAGQLKDSDLIARPLLHYQRWTCASPAYLAAHGTPGSPAELAEHSCLAYRHGPQTEYWEYWIDATVQRIPVHGNMTSNEATALLTWAKNGQGIIRQPSWFVADAIQKQELVTILNEFVVRKRSELPGIYAVLPRARHYPAKVEAFIGFIAQKMPDIGYAAPTQASLSEQRMGGSRGQ